MTTLRVGVVNGLTDDEIIAIRRSVRPDLSDGALWTDTLAFAREVERMATRSLRDRVRELEAERDALRAMANRGGHLNAANAVIEQERAENERLRALLVMIRNSDEWTLLKMGARNAIDAALAGKKPTERP